MRKDIDALLYMWIVGNMIGAMYVALRITGRVNILGYRKDKLDPRGKGLILICNHPSPAEPVFLPFLFFPWFLFSTKFIPYSLPASEYYHKWWFMPLRKLSISIERQSPRGALNSAKKVERALLDGKIVILHPENERIFTDEGADTRYSASGKRLKTFQTATRRLFLKTNSTVLPVWMDGGQDVIPNKTDIPEHRFQWPRLWKKVTIKIGEPLDVSNMSRGEILTYLEDVLLELADREM